MPADKYMCWSLTKHFNAKNQSLRFQTVKMKFYGQSKRHKQIEFMGIIEITVCLKGVSLCASMLIQLLVMKGEALAMFRNYPTRTFCIQTKRCRDNIHMNFLDYEDYNILCISGYCMHSNQRAHSLCLVKMRSSAEKRPQMKQIKPPCQQEYAKEIP